MIDDIKLKLAALAPDQFEALCLELLPLVCPSYAGIEPNKAKTGKTRKGTPDAYVPLPDGSYIAFQFTTQQERVEPKVLEDLRKLEDCHLKGKIVKAVVCLNTYVASERETYRQACENMGWEFDIFSLQRMAQCLLQRPELCSKYLCISSVAPEEFVPARQPEVIMFDCGNRIAEVRSELRLSSSEFIELLGFRSEKLYLSIEQQREEATVDLIERVSEKTGVSSTWLKHGRGPRYEVRRLIFDSTDSTYEKLRSLNPEALYLTLDLEEFYLCGAAKLNTYRWQHLCFGVGLAFWTWVDEHQKIGRLFRLSDKAPRVSLALPELAAESLMQCC